jgi:hypothetical protein
MFSPARPSAGSGTLALHRVAARALVRLAGQGDDPFARVFNDPMAAASTEEMLRRLLDPPGATLDGATAFTRFVTPITRAAREALDFPEGDRVLDALGERGLVAPLVTTRAAADRPEVRRAYESLTRELVTSLAAQASHPRPAGVQDDRCHGRQAGGEVEADRAGADDIERGRGHRGKDLSWRG